MNRYARTVLYIALTFQATWVILNTLVLHRSPGLDIVGVVVLATFTAFAALQSLPRWRWLDVAVRTLMAADFLLAVSDRFGALGAPGASGVSWGDFAHFIDNTRSTTSFLPGSFAATLAVAATVIEIVLGVALLLGTRLELTASAATLLLSVYGTSMVISRPVAEVFHYNVFVLAAGMWSLAATSRPAAVKPVDRPALVVPIRS